MFWIYGGALQFGNAGQAAYDGSSFAAYQDVIIVSANYRTNVFGFVGSPELPLTGQNPGFFDQRLGLEWVQQNIAAFGGNPSKVTIFGESAGAGSVDRLVTTLPGTKLFRAAITESGQASINPSPSTNATVAWNTLVQMLNCTTAASQLACVRSKPATVIQTIIDQAALIFTPTSDGVTQLVNGQAARLAGNIAKVPLLTGTNAQEGRVFVVGDNNLTAFLATFFAGQTQYQRLLAAAYPVGGLYPTAYDAIAQIFTEEVFQCVSHFSCIPIHLSFEEPRLIHFHQPAAIVANATAALGIPTWRYFFNASFPNTQSYPGLGVFHSSEISIVFGTYPTVNVTAQEYALSKFMQGAWANFAKNPTGGPGWNALGTFPADGDLGDLGPAGSSGVTIIPQYPLDARCGLFAPVYAALANNTGDF